MSMYPELQLKSYGNYKLVIQFKRYGIKKFSLIIKNKYQTHYLFTIMNNKKDITMHNNTTGTKLDMYIEINKRKLHYLLDFCNKFYDKYNNTCWLGGLKLLPLEDDVKIAERNYLINNKCSKLKVVQEFILNCYWEL